MSIDTLVAIIGLLAGGGGIGGFFTWRYSRRKEKAEAQQAEAIVAKEVQDMYQQLVADVKSDRDEQKTYIAELKEDRNHLRRDRDELRRRQDEIEETIRSLQMKVAKNGRMMKCLRPFLCGRKCGDRTPVTISEEGEVQSKRPVKKAIEPLDNDAL